MGKLIKEFKEFAMKGNVLDMAIGVIIGGAFGAIVSSVVEDLITPIIGAIFGQPDFSAIHLGPIAIGNFSLGVVNSIKKFKDVTSSTWCYKYVTELSDANVIGGYTDDPAFREAKLWIKAVREDTEPFVLPEQAFTITQILAFMII